MNIIPKPKKTVYFDGRYDAEKNFTVSSEILKKFSVAWKTYDVDVSAAESGAENIVFYENPGFKEEEYEIVVRKNEIDVTYSTAASAFRAIATLKQIIDAGKKEDIPCMRINDEPDVPVRGVMVAITDESAPTLDELYRLVDKLSIMKYNMLQLYFDTFVFEYGSFRKYLKGKAYITQDEIHLLDEYCRERHIELMANQELLGHMFRWLEQDELKHLGIPRDGAELFTVNPLLDETFEFAKKIIDDVVPHFSSNTVHIGMDEPHGMGNGSTAAYCKTFGDSDLVAEYITKISRYIKEKYKKRSMFWGDFLVKNPETLKKLPKDVIFVDWGYEQGHKFDRNILACRDAGISAYVAPGTQFWCTYTGRTDLMVENIFDAAEAARFFGVDGFLITDWILTETPVLTEFTYAFGGAFAWNSGYNTSVAESGNEYNCRYRNEIVKSVIKFYDDVILKSTGERSCADIIFRMGNYYHLEQPDAVATWNGTQLYNQMYCKGCANGTLSPECLLDIIEYMEKLKKRLPECRIECRDAADILDELDYKIELVIAAANMMGLKHAEGTKYESEFTKPDTDKLTERRRRCWVRHNKASESSEAVINKYKTMDDYLK